MSRAAHEQERAHSYLEQAVGIAIESIAAGGGPFGAVIARVGGLVAVGNNQVVSTNDPTAHAEMVALRNACKHLGTHVLSGCTMYCSCEPCPMCLGAIYWARMDAVWYSATRNDAARVGFSDAMIYRELCMNPSERTVKMWAHKVPESDAVFKRWEDCSKKTMY